MKNTFRIRGLSKPNSFTLEHDDELFNAPSKLPQDRFEALFAYAKNDWDDPKFAVVEYAKWNDDGMPIDGVVIEVLL
jgi:hypothetical protein